MPFEWTITVVGAMLCIPYGWCLFAVTRSQQIWVGRIGPLIGVVGTVVLAGMAMSGHTDVAGHEGVVTDYIVNVMPEHVAAEEVPEVPENMTHAKSLVSVSRTTHDIEPRPSEDHVFYVDQDGISSWITKERYKLLVRKH